MTKRHEPIFIFRNEAGAEPENHAPEHPFEMLGMAIFAAFIGFVISISAPEPVRSDASSGAITTRR